MTYVIGLPSLYELCQLCYLTMKLDIFMPPTLNLEWHIAFGLCVRACVRSSRFFMHAISNEPWMLEF